MAQGNARFQGSARVVLKQTIAGYANGNQASWKFMQGNPWPIFSVTHTNSFIGQVNSFRVDVFDVASGVGRVTSFISTAVGGTPATAGTNTPFGWWANRVVGVTGGQFASSPFNAATAYDAFSRQAIPGAGWNLSTYPSKRIRTTDNTHGETPQFGWSNGVLMPTYGHAAVSTALHADLGMSFVNDDGSVTADVLASLGGRAFNGTIPGSNYFLETQGGTSKLAFLSGGALTDVPVTWDIAALNTVLQNSVSGLAPWAQSTYAGWLFWYSQLTNGTFVDPAGITHGNCLILTAADGSAYWIFDLIAGDANAAVALGSNGGLASAHFTPDGVVWFQSVTTAGVQDKVFTSLNTSTLIPPKFLPIYPPQKLPANMPTHYESVGTLKGTL